MKLSSGGRLHRRYLLTLPQNCSSPLRNQILPLLDGNSADREGHHLCIPETFHICVDISQLINLFNGCLRGGVQGNNHEVLDSWGTGKRQRSRISSVKIPWTLLQGNRLSPKSHGLYHLGPPISRRSSGWDLNKLMVIRLPFSAHKTSFLPVALHDWEKAGRQCSSLALWVFLFFHF